MANHHVLAVIENSIYHILAAKSRRRKPHLQQVKLQSENLTRGKFRNALSAAILASQANGTSGEDDPVQC